MRKAEPEVLQMIPHQTPSWNQSLLSGLDSVGVTTAAEKLGPSKPTSCAAIGAIAIANATTCIHHRWTRAAFAHHSEELASRFMAFTVPWCSPMVERLGRRFR